MLKHYRYRNEYGVYGYFVDDSDLAMQLLKEGFKVEIAEYSIGNAKCQNWIPLENYRKKISESEANMRGKKKISKEDAKKMREMRDNGVKINDIAKQFDISRGNVSYWLDPKIKHPSSKKTGNEIPGVIETRPDSMERDPLEPASYLKIEGTCRISIIIKPDQIILNIEK